MEKSAQECGAINLQPVRIESTESTRQHTEAREGLQDWPRNISTNKQACKTCRAPAATSPDTTFQLLHNYLLTYHHPTVC